MKAAIVNQRGLHARASAKFVETASKFRSEITVVKDDNSVSGRSIMGLMMLAAAKGTIVELVANGTGRERGHRRAHVSDRRPVPRRFLSSRPLC